MKSLYRRHRPLRLSDVVGQEQVTKTLENSLAQKKISHAYLFVGPRGTGKTSVARIFAHEINGFNYTVEDDYVDIIEIDGASNRGIDNIRELREKAAIAPTDGEYKVYIIDEVHMLTKEAFNALLKTLEEPPAHVVFIMATTDAYKVPVTITSRAQTFTFKLADTKTMAGYLKTVCDEEKIIITDGALEIIAKRGGGSFRDSLSLLDQISTLSAKDGITKDLVISAMGLPEDEKITRLLKDYETNGITEIATDLKDLLLSGVRPEIIAENIMNVIIANPKVELIDLLAKLPEIKAPFAEAKLLVALCNNKATSTSQIRPKTADVTNRSNHEEVLRQAKTPNLTTTIDNTDGAINFSWQDFVKKVSELNDAISTQLNKCKHAISGGELHIYPDKRITKTILTREGNQRILSTSASSFKIVIHDPGEIPEGTTKDALISKISAIMGGEVQNDGGGSPF